MFCMQKVLRPVHPEVGPPNHLSDLRQPQRTQPNRKSKIVSQNKQSVGIFLVTLPLVCLLPCPLLTASKKPANTTTMAAPCPLLGDGITDDTLLNIARFLPTAKDLLCLQLACPRFAAKVIAATGSAQGGAAAAPVMLSIVEEAGRQWITGCSEQERGWAPRRELESWLGLMREVELLRLPLVFGRAHASLTLIEGGAVATKDVDGSWWCAASTVVMRSGRHFAQFTVESDDAFKSFGVIRAGWDVELGTGAYIVDGHCFYHTANRQRWPGNRYWEGMQAAREQGDRIGMLLDLDQGSMTVWENGVKVGMMQAEGLSGPLCWAVSVGDGRGATM